MVYLRPSSIDPFNGTFLRREGAMAHLFKCPACGHRLRVSDDWLGKPLVCTRCSEVIRLPSREDLAHSLSQSATKANEGALSKLLRKAPGESSAALEGSIRGAISGLLAGTLVRLFADLLFRKAVGNIVSDILHEFVIGFGLGALLGAILGVAGRRLRPDFPTKSGPALLAGGAVIGSLVAAIILDFRWIPFGAGIGAVGAKLWPLRGSRVSAAPSPPHHRTPVDPSQRRGR
jgi:hypothetical protein